MYDERVRLHGIVDMLSESDLKRISAMLYAYMESEYEILTEEEAQELENVKKGQYINASEYWKARGV